MPITFIVPVTSAKPSRQIGRILIPSDLKIAPKIGEQIKLDSLPVPRTVLKVEYRIKEGRIFVTLQELEMPTVAEAKALLDLLLKGGMTLAQDN